MDDRTLIERAAKAAGFELPSYPDDHDEIGRQYTEALGLWVFRPWGWGWFNPLNDDGDALRLAVRLASLSKGAHFQVSISAMYDGRGFANAGFFSRDNPTESAVEHDLGAATRRAIVRAAAALAEQRTGWRE